METDTIQSNDRSEEEDADFEAVAAIICSVDPVPELALKTAREKGYAATLAGDLGLDSLDQLEACMGIEGAFGIRFSDEEWEGVETIGDAISLMRSKRDGVPALMRRGGAGFRAVEPRGEDTE